MKSKVKNKLKQISQQQKSIVSPGKSVSKGSSVKSSEAKSSGSSSEKPAAVLNTWGAILPAPSATSHRSKLREDARKAFSKK